LAGQPGYRSGLKYSDAEYFNLTHNEGRIAKAEHGRAPPTIAEIRKVLAIIPGRTELERRDRALIAFTLLTGMRDDAVASLSLEHVNLLKRTVFQDARQVRTKNRKTFTSWFFPVGNDIEEIVVDWVRYLLDVKGLGPEEPVFPITITRLEESGRFEPVGVGREHWSNADPIRKVFRKAFQAAELPYANPHSFRNTLTLYGEVVCKSPEEFKAWSQNLGHENVSTTFSAYGEVAVQRQGEVMEALNKRMVGGSGGDPDPATIAAVVSYLQRRAPQVN
jgi:integrase